MDILTIGHCTVDLYMKIAGNNISEEVSGEGPKVCFNHGSKILVEDFKTSIGGNALNVAIATKLLGLNSGIYTELGDDDYAEKIIKELDEFKINTSLCEKNSGKRTNVSTVIVYNQERTIFAYHEKQKYAVRNWTTPKIIYYTSVPEGYETFQEELIKYQDKKSPSILAFNPGSVHFKNGVKSFENVLAITDILFVNKEEAHIIAGIKLEKETSSDREQLHKELFKKGPKLVIITDGDKDVTAYDGKKLYIQKAYKSQKSVVDNTGAGDAFAGGFVSAIFYGKSLEEALKWGVVNSGSEITEVGAIPGLLNRAQLETIVKEI
jgi:fructoselysine 6-kinase